MESLVLKTLFPGIPDRQPPENRTPSPGKLQTRLPVSDSTLPYAEYLHLPFFVPFVFFVDRFSVLRQRVAKQPGGNIHDRNHALVVHAFRADDGERADDFAVGGIGRGDDAAR